MLPPYPKRISRGTAPSMGLDLLALYTFDRGQIADTTTSQFVWELGPSPGHSFGMPTVQDFEAFERSQDDAFKRQACPWTLENHEQHLKEMFPDSDDQWAYREWAMNKAKEDLTKARTPISAKEMTEMLEGMNYNDIKSRIAVYRELYKEVRPWIPIGRDEVGDLYRIVSQTDVLTSDRKPPDTHGVADFGILGVNTNVQPPKPACRRAANMSEESNVSNESDDQDEGGFVFFEIGTFQVLLVESPYEIQSLDGAGKADWSDTHFVAVMRVSRSGNANGVYLLYDFIWRDEMTYKRMR